MRAHRALCSMYCVLEYSAYTWELYLYLYLCLYLVSPFVTARAVSLPTANRQVLPGNPPLYQQRRFLSARIHSVRSNPWPIIIPSARCPSSPDPSHATAVKAANLNPRPVWISTPYFARRRKRDQLLRPNSESLNLLNPLICLLACCFLLGGRAASALLPPAVGRPVPRPPLTSRSSDFQYDIPHSFVLTCTYCTRAPIDLCPPRLPHVRTSSIWVACCRCFYFYHTPQLPPSPSPPPPLSTSSSRLEPSRLIVPVLTIPRDWITRIRGREDEDSLLSIGTIDSGY